MKDPLFRETDTLQRGKDYLRNLNTGTLDITNLTPRLAFLKCRNGSDAGQVECAKVDAFNIAIVIPRSATNDIDVNSSYLIDIAFQSPDTGRIIPFGYVALTAEQGKVYL